MSEEITLEFADYLCYGIFGIILIFFWVWWVLMRLGLDKRWFVMPASLFISRNFYFFLPAFLVGFAIMLLGMVFSEGFAVLITFGFYALGFVFAYFEPLWLSPAWYSWLKKEHGDILPYLAQEAHELGRQVWLSRVKTQADLERWVEDFRRRHHLNKGGDRGKK